MPACRPLFYGYSRALAVWIACAALALVPHMAGAQTQTYTEAKVLAVAYSGAGKDRKGSTIPVTVRVAETPNGQPSVGVIQEYFGGAGDTCVASAWLAAICSAHMLDQLLSDYEITVRVGGHVDGPSMGMLLTSTMLALMQGETVLPGVTMTGTVNPDGSVGPVGGIEFKMAGAKAAGLTKFGYPYGERISFDPATKQQVDLQERAKSLGLEAVEIHDVFDAYQLLTGKALHRQKPIPENEMELSTEMANRVRGACATLRADAERRATACEAKLKGMSADRLRKLVAGIAQEQLGSMQYAIDGARAMANDSQKAELDGSFAAAYLRAMMADVQSRIAESALELLIPLGALDLNESRRVYESQAEATLKKIDTLKLDLRKHILKETVGGKVDALHSYLQYGESRVHYYWGAKRHREIEEVWGPAMKILSAPRTKKGLSPAEINVVSHLIHLLRQSTAMWAVAEGRADAASHWASFATEVGKPIKDNPATFDRLGKAYGAGASASIGYFRALILPQLARDKSAGALEAAQLTFSQVEPNFDLIAAASTFAEHAESGLSAKDGVEPLDRFASGLYSFVGVSTYLNKYYNFAAQGVPQGRGKTDSEGLPAYQLTNRKALMRTLDAARMRVLEECAAVKEKVGFVPESIKLNYDLATTVRDGTDEDRLMALRAYWRCNILCYLTRLLVR